MALLRNLKQFFNLQFRIERCADDVYSESDEEEEEDKAEEATNEQVAPFPQTFIFSCIGIGLTNFARR